MKRFLKYFIPPTILWSLVWYFLVGSTSFHEDYADCENLVKDGPALCQEASLVVLGTGIAVIFTIAVFLAVLGIYILKTDNQTST